jgi:hypothetical protein
MIQPVFLFSLNIHSCQKKKLSDLDIVHIYLYLLQLPLGGRQQLVNNIYNNNNNNNNKSRVLDATLFNTKTCHTGKLSCLVNYKDFDKKICI